MTGKNRMAYILMVHKGNGLESLGRLELHSSSMGLMSQTLSA